MTRCRFGWGLLVCCLGALVVLGCLLPGGAARAGVPDETPFFASQSDGWPNLAAADQLRVQGPVTTMLLFTGVIVPARCVQAAIDARGGDVDYPYEEVRKTIQDADLAIGTFNATMSDYPPHTGCVRTFVLVGGSKNADALARAGFDVMSVATNHIKNCGIATCGDRAFFDTLDNLRRVSILPVGAGRDLAEALKPVVVTVNGIRFGIVSQGQIEQSAFAGEKKPGIAVLSKENMAAAIAEARKVSDVVIAMPHWGPEDVAWPTWIQRNLAKEIAAARPDLIVGNHTHVVQAVQTIDGVPVFYGLGNFVFDQGLRDHRQGVMLLVYFVGQRYAGYQFIPTHVDQDGRVHIAEPEEAKEILDRVNGESQKLR
jgi:poly-gamma-glutamate synthesis protein (capsule biosynthesis protein)